MKEILPRLAPTVMATTVLSAMFSTTLIPVDQAIAATINFDSFAGMVNVPGTTVPLNAQLSNQFQSTTGAVFRSSNNSYVAVVNLTGATPSNPNGVGGVNVNGNLNYNVPWEIRFTNPTNPSQAAVTNFFQILTDTIPLNSGTVTLEAFDINETLIQSLTVIDNQPGQVLSLSATGIHSLRLSQTSGTVAFDNIQFNDVQPLSPVQSIPESTPILGLFFISVLGISSTFYQRL